MKYYPAAASLSEVKIIEELEQKRFLASFHYFKKSASILNDYVKQGYDIIVDSGAFSAMNLGAKIDIGEYCNFIKEVGSTYYATLDVIGDAKATLKNHEIMINQYGLKPIITFHMGSLIEELDPLLEYPYIAYGGLVFNPGLMNHCDEVWSYMLKRAPHIKVHGFGLTNVEMMKRYPWHSVDSSSYKSCRRFGRQNILSTDLNFKTWSEEEYRAKLNRLGYNMAALDNATKYKVYDFYSAQSYHTYAEHLTELNKIKKFDYLTAQQKLF